MKKLIFSAALVLSLGLAACGDIEESSNGVEKESKIKTEESEKYEVTPVEDVEIDMSYANNTSIPLNDRLQKIATDLFGATTVQGTERNITVDSMGDAFFLKLMIDDGVTLNNTLEIAQRNTIDILEVLQRVEDWQMITINWQGNFKDSTGKSSIGSALAVGITKEDLEKIDFENFNPNDLKKVATNYGTHNDFK